MKAKQISLICGALLLATLLIAAAIYLAPSKTIDFRGYVQEIYFDDTNGGSKQVAAIKVRAEDCDRSVSQYINLVLKEHLQKGAKGN